jgi:oryzin
MKVFHSLFSFAFLGSLLAGAAPVEPNLGADSDVIAGKYIVELRPGTSPEGIVAHHNLVRSLHRRNLGDILGDTLGGITGGILKTYALGGFNAYLGEFDDATISAIESLEDVLSVEPDRYIHLSNLKTQANAPWNLGSISHRTPGSNEYIYEKPAGDGSFAYVLDTGVRATHSEFEGRVIPGYNALEDTDPSDHVGHGTHVAGIIAGKTYGVAKKTTIVAVKVMNSLRVRSSSAYEAKTAY